MSKMKKIAAMTAALLISASTMGYLPQDSIKISNVTANAAEEEITSVEINWWNFPDDNFRWYVAEEFDKNTDGLLSAEEIAAVTKIDVHNKGISDLTGIEYFENLEYLDCSLNKLTTLDLNNNTALIELNCYYNQLTSLDVSSNTALIVLYCELNQLTSLDVSSNTALLYLSCLSNQLTSLDISSNTALIGLECGENQLTSLDVSNNTALEWLKCYDNQLTSLDVSNNTALEWLYFDNNKLASLDLSNNTTLTSLSCSDNKLTSLDVTNTKLEKATAWGNKYEISVIGNTFDLSTLPAGFDVTNASDWTNGTVEGNILTIEDTSKEVTYKYLYGYGVSETFTLVPQIEETPVETTTAPKTTTTTTTTTATTTTPAANETPEEELPQTGFSKLYNCVPVSAGALVLLGMFAVKKSRKKDEV